MFSLISSKSQPHYLPLLREWFVLQWGDIDPFEGTVAGFIIPSPLLVVAKDKLLGGLAFSTAPNPDTKEIEVWINALFVVPEFRGKGLGSQLIQGAETEAAGFNRKELFVHTEFPDLYRRLGWREVEHSGEFHVLSKAL